MSLARCLFGKAYEVWKLLYFDLHLVVHTMLPFPSHAALLLKEKECHHLTCWWFCIWWPYAAFACVWCIRHYRLGWGSVAESELVMWRSSHQRTQSPRAPQTETQSYQVFEFQSRKIGPPQQSILLSSVWSSCALFLKSHVKSRNHNVQYVVYFIPIFRLPQGRLGRAWHKYE